MPKPSADAIRAAVPLTKHPCRPADPFLACNVCGVPFVFHDLPPTLHREHDERDRPIPGVAALVFLGRGKDHEQCLRELEAHPCLYGEETGAPGHFPKLCGECVYRRGLGCTHPDLKANGGPGLRVGLSGFATAIVCTRSGCFTPMKSALDCAGQKLRGE